jgi:large subunit ribosomal protein L31e
MEKDDKENIETKKEEAQSEAADEEELGEELETALKEEGEEAEEPKAEKEEAEQKAAEEAEASEEEKVKPPSKKEKEEEEEIVEERIYTVPLGKAWIMPPNKRTPRAVRMLRSFINKHMKMESRKESETEEEEEPKKLSISNEVNQRMWERGIEKPPRKIRVRAAKDKEGNVTVYLAEGD